MDMNRDQSARDAMLIFSDEGYIGGVRHFHLLNAETLKALIAQGFADPQDAQNLAPNLGEMLKFLEAHPTFTAHGYAVDGVRTDYRISIEGVNSEKHSRQDMLDFIDTFKNADDVRVGLDWCFCWYD